MRENFEGGTSIAWEAEPWSLGATAYFGPGEMTAMFPHVGTVEGRFILRENTRPHSSLWKARRSLVFGLPARLVPQSEKSESPAQAGLVLRKHNMSCGFSRGSCRSEDDTQ